MSKPEKGILDCLLGNCRLETGLLGCGLEAHCLFDIFLDHFICAHDCSLLICLNSTTHTQGLDSQGKVLPLIESHSSAKTGRASRFSIPSPKSFCHTMPSARASSSEMSHNRSTRTFRISSVIRLIFFSMWMEGFQAKCDLMSSGISALD